MMPSAAPDHVALAPARERARRVSRVSVDGSGRVSSALALVAALHAACAEPSIDVSLAVPERYRAKVASLRVRVLTVPSPDVLSCDHLAFQDAADAVIAANQVLDVTQRARGGPLTGIPRLGDKLVWIEGISEQGLPVVSACAAVGEIDDDATVALIAEPNTIVVADSSDLGGGLPGRVTLAVSDTDGQLLSGIAIRWTVAGPTGAAMTGEEVSAGEGRAQILPPQPTAPGPAVLDVRVRWARQRVPLIPGFTRGRVLLDEVLPGPAEDAVPAETESLVVAGRVGPGGEPGFAALGPAGSLGTGRQAFLAWYDASAQPPIQRITTAEIPGATALGLFRDQPRDRVIAASGVRWLEVLPDGTTPEVATPGFAARRIVSVGPCEPSGGGEVLLAQSAVTGELQALTPGGVVASPFVQLAPAGARLLTAGCAAGIDGALYRVAVFDPGDDLRLVAQMNPARAGALSTFPFGLGFTPHTADEPAALLATSVFLDGITIARHRLVRVDEELLDTEIVAEDPSISVVRAAQGGDVDGDGRVDVAALMDFGVDSDLGRRALIQIVLGATHAGARITGAQLEAGVADPHLIVADFDLDGVDDLLLADRGRVKIYAMGPQ